MSDREHVEDQIDEWIKKHEEAVKANCCGTALEICDARLYELWVELVELPREEKAQ